MKPQPKALPITSVDSEAEAQSLLVRYGKLSYDEKCFVWSGFDGTMDAFWEISEKVERETQ